MFALVKIKIPTNLSAKALELHCSFTFNLSDQAVYDKPGAKQKIGLIFGCLDLKYGGILAGNTSWDSLEIWRYKVPQYT